MEKASNWCMPSFSSYQGLLPLLFLFHDVFALIDDNICSVMTTSRKKGAEDFLSSSPNLTDSILSDDTREHCSNISVSILTSLVWFGMIFLSILIISQYYSSTNCAQTNLAHCNIKLFRETKLKYLYFSCFM